MPPETGSLWEQISPPAKPLPILSGHHTTQLAIIGGGFLGLSTALHAAQSGQAVTVLEAAAPGFGASGRNTGFVVPSLKSAIGPEDAARRLGETHAKRLLKLVAGSGTKTFDLIRAEQIACHVEQVGWLQPGHSAAAEKMLASRLAPLRAAGVDIEYLDRAAMAALTGLPDLHGGLRVTSGGQINPLAYASGLATAAGGAGASIYAQSPAIRITRAGNGWRIETPAGSLLADTVLLATNAMAPRGLMPDMKASLIPARVFQIATQVMPADLRARLLPAGAPVADTRRHTFALRWSPDGRLVTGGLVPPGPGRARAAARSFAKRLRRLVPDLPPIKAEYVWSGHIAGTLDFLPRMIRLDQGLYGAIGCNGRGVALTTALGQEIALFTGGHTAAEDFVLPVTPPQKIPFSRLSGLGPHLWLPWSNLRDSIEADRPAP